MGQLTNENLSGLADAMDKNQEAGTTQENDMINLSQWFKDLVDTVNAPLTISTREHVLSSLIAALKLVENGDFLTKELSAEFEKERPRIKSMLTNNIPIINFKNEADVLFKAIDFLLKAEIKIPPVENITQKEKEMLDNTFNYGQMSLEKVFCIFKSRFTKNNFDPTSYQKPWDVLEKIRPVDNAETNNNTGGTTPPAAANLDGGTTPQATTNIVAATPNPILNHVKPAFIIHNIYTEHQTIQEPGIKGAPLPPKVLPGVVTIEETYYARNLKTLSTSQVPKEKAATQDVASLAQAIKPLVNKVIDSNQHTDNKDRSNLNISNANSKLISEMSKVDREELKEVLGLDSNLNISATQNNETGDIRVAVKSETGEEVISIDFIKGPDGVWQTIKVSALGEGDKFDYSTGLAAQVTRKLGQTLTTREGKPILTAKVEGSSPEQMIDAAYDLIFNKNVPVWDERGKTDNIDAITHYKNVLESKKTSGIINEQQTFKLQQIEAILKYIKTATTPESGHANTEPGVNLYRLALAIEELSIATRDKVVQSTGLDAEFRAGLIATANKAVANSAIIIAERNTYDTKEQTVEHAVPEMTITKITRISGNSLPGDQLPPIQLPSTKSTKRRPGTRN